MIKDFDVVKTQLSELSEILNKFKSESVQLKIVEIVLGHSVTNEEPPIDNTETPTGTSTPKRKKAKPASSKQSEITGNRKASGSGAIATLIKLYDEGFFAKKHSISDITEHCETNMARKIKPNEISGKLGHMIRKGQLTRKKNDEGQYEYIKG